MSLFTVSDLKPKTRPPGRDRRRRRIPTGAPRLMESSGERIERLSTETWSALLDAIRCSSAARLDLLSGRAGCDRVPCPWERLMFCGVSCRCGGAGTVTVEFLRKHYAGLAAEIVQITRPVPVRRSQ